VQDTSLQTDGNWVGTPLRRREELPLLRGEARFVADIEPPGTLHVAFLRSPYAHARIGTIDTAAARGLDGVIDVVTAADLDPVPGPIPVRVHPIPQLNGFLQYALATDKARYVGEPIAAVVACDRYVAEDAVQLIEADLEPLGGVVDTLSALDPGAPLLFEDQGTNMAYSFDSGYGDVDAAFTEAAHVVRATFAAQRHSAVPMETRGLVAEPQPDGRLFVWGPTKVVHANRSVVAELLRLPEDRLRFIETSVGGGFGIRGEVYPEDLMIPLLALRLGRPVKWIEDRSEHLVSANHSREQRHEAEMAFDADGSILGMRSSFVVDQGGYLRTHGVRVAEISAHTQPGPYRIPAYSCHVRCVVSNKTPTGTYRAPGRFEINFVREGLIDRAATLTGIEPAELRRRNLIRAEDLPYQRGTHDFGEPIVYDTGAALDVFERTLQEVDYEEFRVRQAAARAEGRCLGLGIVPFVEDGGLGGLGGTPGEYARVVLDGEGVAVYSGSGDLGQGFETMLSQVVAGELGVTPDAVRVVRGDTDQVPQGGGTWASRGAILSGNAAFLAARELGQRVREAAAEAFDADASDVRVVDGTVRSLDGRELTFAELVGKSGPLEAELVYTQPRMTYSPGAQALVIDLDRETGKIEILRHVVAYDVGRAINPLIVRGQIEGGAAQGIGGALLEEFVYDDNGQPLATTFMDYLLPTASETPAPEVIVLEDAPNPLNPLGVKGVGEVGPPGAGAALAAAFADATGIHAERLPLSPDRVLSLIGDER
jgi:carbon-monoxide dehydrogenase large subunit